MNKNGKVQSILDLNSKEFWTEAELAAYLNQSVATIQKKRCRGELPYHSIGSVIMYSRKEILALIRQSKNRCAKDII